jgi:hypothetical protein
MPCLRDAAGLWHVCALSWVCRKKLFLKKTVAIHNVLKEKTYKIKFLASLILTK